MARDCDTATASGQAAPRAGAADPSATARAAATRARAEKAATMGWLDLGALMFASAAIGVAVTSIMTGVGTSAWVVMAACTLAFSGTGEVAYASVIASGGGLTAALAAALLVSSRFGLLAMSTIGRWKAPWWERVAMAHFTSEIAVAAAIERAPLGERLARRAFWQLCFAPTAGWIIGSGIGLLLGDVVGDTSRIGLDSVFPASFVGAVVGGLRRRDSAVAVVLGATAALAFTPLLPAGLPVLIAAGASVVALAAPATGWRRTPSGPATTTDRASGSRERMSS